MAKGILGTLVNAQVSGAAVGQAIGPALLTAQSLSLVEAVSQVVVSGVKGLLGSSTTSLPDTSGSAKGGGTADSNGTAGADGTTDSGGAAAGGGNGGASNPLIDPQLAGAEAGQGMGPAMELGESPPVTDFFADAFGESGSKGLLGSAATEIPNVGGILFENCSAELTEVEEITGAYWDSKTNSLVLVGKDGLRGEMVSMELPRMDRDHLNVALRAFLGGQPIGVSIDPPSEYRDGIKRGVTPPDGTPMLVSYLGGTEGTLFGAIMFEADRLLKCLDKGVHNETRESVRASIPGFKPLLEMIRPGDERPQNVWHRFWFVIEKVEIKHDPITGALTFGSVRLKVLTETEMDGQVKDKYIDPADEIFTRHLTEHYDEYANDFPILARLKELAKVAAVAKFLVKQEIPFDLGALFKAAPQQVDTPSTTPGISVTSPNVEVRYEGNVTHTQTVSLFGGVDMDSDPYILPDDGTAKHLRNMAESARPSETASSWTFLRNGLTQRALALRFGPPHTPFRRACNDHEFALVCDGALLRLRRDYYSAFRTKGDFGPGWFLWVPFSITVVPASGKRPDVLTRQEAERRTSSAPVLILHDHTSSETNLYRQTEGQDHRGREVFCRVTSQTLNKSGLSFQYDPSECIYFEGNCFSLSRNSLQYFFDSSGYLIEVRTNNRCIVRYHRENGRMVRFGDDSNHTYDIKYNKSEPQRITEITSSDGKRIHYWYNEMGYLIYCRNGIKNRESYAYDTQGRLAEIRDRLGRVISRNVYDDFGDLVTKPTDVVVDKDKRVLRTFEQGRVVSAKEETGATVDYMYGEHNDLSMILIKDHSKRGWRLCYDLRGRLSTLQDHLGRTTQLYYDELDRVNRVLGPEGRSRSFQRDNNGRLTGITDQDGHRWSAKYDGSGRLRTISGPGDKRWVFEYAYQMLVKAHGPEGEVRVMPRKNRITIRAIASNGIWQEQVLNRDLQLMQYQTKGAKNIRFEYDQLGNICSIDNKAGRIHYQVDENALTLTATFQGV